MPTPRHCKSPVTARQRPPSPQPGTSHGRQYTPPRTPGPNYFSDDSPLHPTPPHLRQQQQRGSSSEHYTTSAVASTEAGGEVTEDPAGSSARRSSGEPARKKSRPGIRALTVSTNYLVPMYVFPSSCIFYRYVFISQEPLLLSNRIFCEDSI